MAGCASGPDAPGDTGARLDLGARLGPGEVRAGVIRDEAALVGGISAEGRLGDLKIYNDRAAFVIQAARDDGSYVTRQGGTVLDADVVRPEGQPGRDLVDDWVPLAGVGRIPDPERVWVVDDGREGGPAVVRAEGGEAPVEYVTGALESPDAFPDRGLWFSTDYVLAPDTPLLRVETTVTATRGAVSFAVGDMLVGSLEDGAVWVPGVGRTDALPDGAPWGALVHRENGLAVALLAEPGTVFRSQGAFDVLAGLLPVLAGFSDTVEVPDGDSVTWVRYYGAGPDPATLTDALADLAGGCADAAQVRIVGPDGPVEGARVAVLADGAFSTLAVSGTDGVAEARIPAGSAVTFVADGRGTGLWPDRPAGAGAYPPHGARAVRELALASLTEGAEPVPVARGRGWAAGPGPELTLLEPGSVTLRSGDGLPFEARFSLPAEPSWGDPALVQGYPSGYGALAWARDGEVALDLEPGTYQVLAWRGPRHETTSAIVEVSGGTSITIDLPLAEAWNPEDWIEADFHGHASASPDASVPIEDRLVAAAAVGLQVWSASDHDHVVDYTPLRDALGLGPVLALNTAEEISPVLRGHLNAWHIAEDPSAMNGGAWPWWIRIPETTEEQFAWIRTHFPDAVLQVNHPMSGLASLAGWSPGTIARGDHWCSDFDAVEVLNGGVVGQAVDFYLDLVSRGIRVAPTGTSDSHDRLGPGLSFTWIGAGTSDPADLDTATIADGIRQRRTIASNGPFLAMDPEPGSEVAGPFALEVRALGPSWIAVDTLTLYEDGVPVASAAGPAATFEIVPAHDAAYVVVATGATPMDPVSHATPWALASAILADAEGDGWVPPLPPLEVRGGR